LTPEEFAAWLRQRIGEAEARRLDGGSDAGSLVLATRPKVGRRVGTRPEGGVYTFTLDELWGLLGRLERQLEARALAAEAAS